MAFGILEQATGRAHPPGTLLLQDRSLEGSNIVQVRVPQPSNSPQDPLNMSKARKELYFAALLYGACVAGSVGPLLIPGFSIIAAEFDITLTQVTILNGALIMTLGLSAYLCAPLADVCGRRLIYLTTSALTTAGCVWASYARSYASLLASRVVQGLGMGGFMSLAGTASINDVFFVHERGRRVGLWNFAVTTACNVTPVISGYAITDLGWPWSFRLMAIGFGVALLLCLVFVPETLFDRGASTDLIPIPNELAMGGDSLHLDHHSDKIKGLNNEIGANPKETNMEETTRISDVSAAIAFSSPERTALLGLHVMTVESFAKLPAMLLSPILALRYPTVLWTTVMWSVFFTWLIIQGAVADQIYTAPPYNLSPENVGILIGVPPLIGTALGTILGGWVSDIIVKQLASRNGGIFEPEFRLLLIAPAVVTNAAGAYGLGAAISRGSSVWASAVLLGLLNFGTGMGCTAIVSYTNDAIGSMAADSMGIAMIVKSAFAFGLTFVLNEYYAQHGPLTFFLNLGFSNRRRQPLDNPLVCFWKASPILMLF